MDGGELLKLRKEAGLSQQELADKIGAARSSVAQWERGGSNITAYYLVKISQVLNVSIYDLLGIDELHPEQDPDTPAMVEVPVYGQIATGEPIESLPVDDAREVPARVAYRYKDAFLLKVEGESMNKILPDGCFALIEPCVDATIQRAPYAVCVNGYDATIKRVRKLGNGYELIPDSTDPTYKAKLYDYGEPDTPRIAIVGRVVYYVLPYDWSF